MRISTHAPREGSDRIVHGEFVHAHEFQPTLPARGATSAAHGAVGFVHISTHAPREGSDPFLALDNAQGQIISTHAPREGSDIH